MKTNTREENGVFKRQNQRENTLTYWGVSKQNKTRQNNPYMFTKNTHGKEHFKQKKKQIKPA
jgi:hypothetical protein